MSRRVRCPVHSTSVFIRQVDVVPTVRFRLKEFEGRYEKSENDLLAIQSVGQIVGEVLRQLDEERCELETHKEARAKGCGLMIACEKSS